MRKDGKRTVTLNTEILEIFAEANQLRYNGKVCSREWNREVDIEWDGSFDNAVHAIEDAA